MRLLLVEDDPGLAKTVAKGLREHGYAVDVTGDGIDALIRTAVNAYDAIVLDVVLPGKDGLAVCAELRRQGVKAPVLMLTARDAVEDRVRGLDAGADDYLTKPFAFAELLARVRALLRRAPRLRGVTLRVGDLVVDTATRRITRAGRPIALTAKEFALLEYFVTNADRVLGREAIGEHVWDEAFDPASNLIDVYVGRLRRKIEQDGEPPLIHTRRGEGYVCSAGGDAGADA